MSVELVGPFVEEWRVVLDGYEVPNLSAIVRKDGGIMLSLDHRFLIEGPREEVEKWIWIVANAMAIGAGYSCHGENCTPINPFKVRMTGIGASKPDLRLVPRDGADAPMVCSHAQQKGPADDAASP